MTSFTIKLVDTDDCEDKDILDDEVHIDHDLNTSEIVSDSDVEPCIVCRAEERQEHYLHIMCSM